MNKVGVDKDSRARARGPQKIRLRMESGLFRKEKKRIARSNTGQIDEKWIAAPASLGMV